MTSRRSYKNKITIDNSFFVDADDINIFGIV